MILFGPEEKQDIKVVGVGDAQRLQEEEHSTRNEVLMRLTGDVHLAENRGSGIRATIGEMRRANLEPPRFEDGRASPWVTFRNHTVMGPGAIAWLNRLPRQAVLGYPPGPRQPCGCVLQLCHIM